MIIWGKLGWLANSYLLHLTNSISVTSIYFVHTYIASNLLKVASWHEFLDLQKFVFLAKFFNKHHYCYCEQVEMSAHVGDYIKSLYWFTLSQICQSSNIIAYHFLKVISCAILMYLQTFCFPCDTCYLSQSISTFLCSLLASWMYLMLCVWSPWMYHNRKLSLWPCFQAKSPLGMFHDFFWISCSTLFVYTLCVHVSLWINIFWCCLLRNLYTWERIHL